MDRSSEECEKPRSVQEGSVVVHLVPSGNGKGPGTKSALFYNPSMVQNRDMSIVILSALLSGEHLPGKEHIDVLDGLCGSGIRVIRFHKEVGTYQGRVRYMGCDRESLAIEHGKRAALENEVDIGFFQDDLNHHLHGRKYSYIDVDPFGPPVQFIPSALSSLLSGGVLAVTATDTAALTGSARRAASRRYWTDIIKTDFMHEMSCRVLLGYIARCASTLERAVKPLLLYSSDHYVRGYLQVIKSASKADSCLRSLGYLAIDPPASPVVIRSLEEMTNGFDGKQVIGPLWIGPLEDKGLIGPILDIIASGSGPMRYVSTTRSIETIMNRAQEEANMPPGGYDMNSLSSSLKGSPPPIEKFIVSLRKGGHRASRSRFSHTLVKTDANYNEVVSSFKMYCSGGGH